jgi:hypothetical protein
MRSPQFIHTFYDRPYFVDSDGPGGHRQQTEGFAVQSHGEAFASLVKNSQYSQLEGREELFERV